jgi:hypothetical protein
MSKRLISIILLLAAAALGCPAPEGTTTIERGGSGGQEAVGASDSLQVERIPAEQRPPQEPAAEPNPNERAIGQMREYSERELGVDPHHFGYVSGHLTVNVIRADGDVEHVGTFNVVTTVGLQFVVDAFQNTTELESFIFHAVGTGTTAADASDTALETENLLGNADRCNGSQGENGATTYRTQCTITKTNAGTAAITEAGLLSADATGVLFARQVFAAVNLSQNDSIQTTWDITISAPVPAPN